MFHISIMNPTVDSQAKPRKEASQVKPRNVPSKNASLGKCHIYDPDPFAKSIASYFDYSTIPECPRFKSPFVALSPTSFGLEKKRALKIKKKRPRGCKYTVIEGQNQEKGQEVSFNALKETKVEASFVKIECKNDPLVHFVSLPHRPKNVAEKKREIKSKERASRPQTPPAKPFNK